ncbi:MAG: endolytic transglycosylase MltG [Patescibacteria group bacterium]|nr:endolytic transglycosylase MltG [Patescibacteria group bacterium]
MASLERFLEQVFDTGHRALDYLALRWEAHTNRRSIIIISSVGLLVIGLYLFAVRPPDGFPIGDLVSVPEGASLSEVANILKKDDVVRSELALRLMVMMYGAERTIHSGDYIFDKPLGAFAIARAISIGQYGLEPLRIRIPEGASVREIALIFGTRLQRFNAENFLAQAQPHEGYLFPDTYFFLPNATENTILQAMRQNFDSQTAELLPEIASSTRSLADIVTMASTIEREAYDSGDRRLISGVLWNRIRLGMPLQVDAPFVYSIGKGTFQLTVQDLAEQSPYNTYVNKGLPPTPIGNPSLDSLDAALYPAKTDYLYFLADKRGVTHFCKTYDCHLANKARYF